MNKVYREQYMHVWQKNEKSFPTTVWNSQCIFEMVYSWWFKSYMEEGFVAILLACIISLVMILNIIILTELLNSVLLGRFWKDYAITYSLHEWRSNLYSAKKGVQWSSFRKVFLSQINSQKNEILCMMYSLFVCYRVKNISLKKDK